LLAEARAWAESAPGEVLRATLIDIEADAAVAARRMAAFEVDPAELVCRDFGGGARLLSDFESRTKRTGGWSWRRERSGRWTSPARYNRCRSWAITETWRFWACPRRASAGGSWKRRKRRCATSGGGSISEEASDNELLDALCAMSLELGTIASATRYRLSATAAYARLVEERLATLAPVALPGFASLADFTQRRFYPAIRTCETVVRRQQEIARAFRPAHLVAAHPDRDADREPERAASEIAGEGDCDPAASATSG